MPAYHDKIGENSMKAGIVLGIYKCGSVIRGYTKHRYQDKKDKRKEKIRKGSKPKVLCYWQLERRPAGSVTG